MTLPKHFAPYAPWVVKGWAAYSKSIGGPEIAADFRRNLTRAASTLLPTLDATQKPPATLPPHRQEGE